MVHNLEVVGRSATKTSLTILVKQTQHDVGEIVAIVDAVACFIWEDDARLADFEEQKAALLVVEGCDTNEHLVDEDAERPPVNREVVTLLCYHLGGEVLGSAAESACQVAISHGLCEAVIDDLKISRLVDQDVFKLEVSVHNALGMEIADGEADLEGVELDGLLRQPLLCLEDLVELTTTYERHDEVEALGRLEEILHTDEEWMVTAE